MNYLDRYNDDMTKTQETKECPKCEGAGVIRPIENPDWPEGVGPHLGSPEECPVCHGEALGTCDQSTAPDYHQHHGSHIQYPSCWGWIPGHVATPREGV